MEAEARYKTGAGSVELAIGARPVRGEALSREKIKEGTTQLTDHRVTTVGRENIK